MKRLILEMTDNRWTKICLRQEVRGILINNKSKWGEELEKGVRDVGECEIIRGIWDYKGDNDTKDKIDRGLNTKME